MQICPVDIFPIDNAAFAAMLYAVRIGRKLSLLQTDSAIRLTVREMLRLNWPNSLHVSLRFSLFSAVVKLLDL